MKLFSLLSLLTLLATSLSAASSSVEKWDIFELEFEGPTEGNPFIDVELEAVFTNGIDTIEVPGFYDGDGVYRVRFSPDETGHWSYLTKSNNPRLNHKLGTFKVTPAAGNNHGPVRVHNTYHFAYADGTPFKQIGTTIYNWIDTPEELQEQTLEVLASAPFNKARMLITQQPTPYKKKFPPSRWPYQGTPPNDWDYERFNPEYFRHYEKRIGQLRDLGIEADVILFNPYGKFGFNRMSREHDELYLRYVIARFGAFRNIWWSLANEYDFMRHRPVSYWNWVGTLVDSADPHNRLISIHNGTVIYDHTKPWITHVSMQNGAAVAEPGRAQMYRLWQKPVVYDEVNYEGSGPYRWGELTAEEMVHAFWCGTVAGTYVGHGDYFFTEIEDTWTSFGGFMTGNSAPRLAFLRKILEDSPDQGIDPIDKWRDVNTGGVHGQYYLTYFGREAPTEWEFKLYRTEVADGQRYAVDIIDTWNMTVTPVEGVFVAKKLDRYHFVDASARKVKLPGKPGIAVRVRRLGEDGRPVHLTQKAE